MKKSGVFAGILCAAAVLTGCGGQKQEQTEKSTEAYSVEQMKQDLLEASEKLEASDRLHFESPVEITGLGVTYDGRPAEFNGCYYWPAIERLTNAHISVDWHEAEGYASAVAATLLMDISELLENLGIKKLILPVRIRRVLLIIKLLYLLEMKKHWKENYQHYNLLMIIILNLF